MIQKDTFTKQHITKMKGNKKVDPSLLERNIYALGLLEALATVGLPFIFKGGTSLTLLLDSPKRLSVDIDITVTPGIEIDFYVQKASELFPFLRVEEQIRKGRNNIVKKHYQFFYKSHVRDGEFYILLDVLFENNFYTEIVYKRIQSNFLITDSPYVEVKVPSADCLLGDKLTAFAPHTTGIPFGVGKEVEIIKQFYDIGCLLNVFSDIELTKNTYKQISIAEIAYRGGNYSSNFALEDTINAALCIASQGMVYPEDFTKLKEGIKGIATYIYEEKFSVETAIPIACQIIYLAACILTGQSFNKISDTTSYVESKITNRKFSKLSYLKKIDLVSFGYIVETIKLLNEPT